MPAPKRALAAAASLVVCVACYAAEPDASLPVRTATHARTDMVVAADPLAARAGADTLAAGGSAADAAIATALVLGLVEPQSSGIGGGGFALAYHAQTRTLIGFDGRETAPAAATPDLFVEPSGQPMDFLKAVASGRSVGVPGELRMLALLHARAGRLPLARLVEPAVALAEQGFAMPKRMAAIAQWLASYLSGDAAARAYLFDASGAAKAAGTVVTNRPYAHILRRWAATGDGAFYDGAVAAEIAETVAGDRRAGGGGAMTPGDLAAYRALERPPVCGGYRGYKVCGIGPPSAGGIATLQMLALLEPYDLGREHGLSVNAIHLFTQANRLAFADRNAYAADPDAVPVPVAGLLDPAYLRARGGLMVTGAIDPAPVPPGLPPGPLAIPALDRSPPRFGGTSHISVVDRDGNAVAMTVTIEGPFGNQRMVEGFFLNNELTDFAFDPGRPDDPVANRPQGGKRPRSAIDPVIVFDPAGKLAFVAGSPGGATIPATVTEALVGMIDFALDPQQAANLPHVQNNNGATVLESLVGPGSAPAAGATGAIGPGDLWIAADQLRALGHRLAPPPIAITSGLAIIAVTPDGLAGGADPRRAGVAIGH